MKVGIIVDIPQGLYCTGCILLESGASAHYDYCRLFSDDEAITNDYGILKHKECPLTKSSKPQAIDSAKGIEDVLDDIESYLKLPLEDKTPRGIDKCEHKKVYLDEENHAIECQECHKILDPFWYLQLLASEWGRRRYYDLAALKAHQALHYKQAQAFARGKHFARPTSGKGQYYWDVYATLHGHDPEFVFAQGGTWYAGENNGWTLGDYCAQLLADKYKRMGLPPPDILKQPT